MTPKGNCFDAGNFTLSRRSLDSGCGDSQPHPIWAAGFVCFDENKPAGFSQNHAHLSLVHRGLNLTDWQKIVFFLDSRLKKWPSEDELPEY